jgi:hypothetical protein
MYIELTEQLVGLGYSEIFMRHDYRHAEEIFFHSGPARLQELLKDEDAPLLARFLAGEILFWKTPDFIKGDQETGKKISAVYSGILEGDLVSANAWGLPGETGLLGEHLLVADRAENILCLYPLLTNNKRVLYEGNREVTVNNDYGYRIKDIAAYYLSVILQHPYLILPVPKERDAEIEKLKMNSDFHAGWNKD